MMDTIVDCLRDTKTLMKGAEATLYFIMIPSLPTDYYAATNLQLCPQDKSPRSRLSKSGCISSLDTCPQEDGLRRPDLGT